MSSRFLVQEFLIPLRPGNDKEGGGCPEHLLGADLQVLVISNREVVALLVNPEKPKVLLKMIADIYISISMGTFGHRKYKSRGEDGNK